jgi:uncharacterized membrane protein
MQRGSNRGFALSTVIWVVVGVVVVVVAVGMLQSIFAGLFKIALIVIGTLFVLGLIARHSEKKES